MKAGRALAPATCGELVQGSIGGRDFLISCPIDVYSQAEVRWVGPLREYGCSAQTAVRVSSMAGAVPGSSKAQQALDLALQALGYPTSGVILRVECPLPPGKGLGTSTADIVATAQAAATACGHPFTPEELARIALALEPSDGIMYPGLTVFRHRAGLSTANSDRLVSGRVALVLGDPPPIEVIILDLGGQVDTLEFNRRPDLVRANAAKEPEVRTALHLIWRGIRTGDPELVGRGATISALAHQPILPKPGLERLVADTSRLGAYGVVNAHSGSVVGILVPPRQAGAAAGGAVVAGRVLDYLEKKRYGSLLGVARVIGGGTVSWPNTEDGCGALPGSWEYPRNASSTSAPT